MFRGCTWSAVLMLLLAAIGCGPVAAPQPTPPPATVVADRSSPSAAVEASGSPYGADLRLFGPVKFTGKPRGVLNPETVSGPPTFTKDQFAWAPEKTFNEWITNLEAGTFKFGVSIHEADGLFPSLKGATVADIGAGYGNNLPAWKELLGPSGRLVETEVDINEAHFMEYAAKKLEFADRTVIILNTFENPCLPVGQFDLVLCSQLHSHITIGPYPKNPTNERIFRDQSAAFLAAIRSSLKSDDSLLIVIEGYQNYKRDPKQLYLEKPAAIENIEKNNFKLVDTRTNDHMWAAAFKKSPAAK